MNELGTITRTQFPFGIESKGSRTQSLETKTNVHQHTTANDKQHPSQIQENTQDTEKAQLGSVLFTTNHAPQHAIHYKNMKQ